MRKRAIQKRKILANMLILRRSNSNSALENAWFINDYKIGENADKEITNSNN